MDLSLFYEVQAPDTSDESAHRAYFEMVEQVELADSLGYRAAWMVEHHFLANFSLSSAPEVAIGYLAAKTKNIRLGHGIVQLPYTINHPVRVAARLAVEDILSNGRMEFGGGRTTTHEEVVGFQLDDERALREFEECLRMLPKMWTEETFSWNSDLLQVPERPINPKPVQKPHPPMWIASQSPRSVEFAARNGLGVLGFGIGVEGSNDLVRMYREKSKDAQPIGHFSNNRFAVLLPTLCLNSDEEALAVADENHRFWRGATSAFYARWVDSGEIPDSYKWMVDFATRRAANSLTMEDIIAAGGAVIGGPETCARVLQRLEDYGVDEVLLIHQIYKTPHEKILESIEKLAKVVKPMLKERAPAPA